MPREPTAGRFSQVNAKPRRAKSLDEVMVLLPLPVPAAALAVISLLQNETQIGV
jgi:hypothetical protein